MLFDTNVWIALLIASHVHHRVAGAYYAGLAATDRVLIPQSVQISVLRLLSNPRVQAAYGLPVISNTDAYGYLARVLASPNVRNLHEPLEVLVTWKDLVQHPTPAPNRWMDAYLCAIARHLGVPLVTCDAGMAVFREYGVDVRVLG